VDSEDEGKHVEVDGIEEEEAKVEMT